MCVWIAASEILVTQWNDMPLFTFWKTISLAEEMPSPSKYDHGIRSWSKDRDGCSVCGVKGVLTWSEWRKSLEVLSSPPYDHCPPLGSYTEAEPLGEVVSSTILSELELPPCIEGTCLHVLGPSLLGCASRSLKCCEACDFISAEHVWELWSQLAKAMQFVSWWHL